MTSIFSPSRLPRVTWTGRSVSIALTGLALLAGMTIFIGNPPKWLSVKDRSATEITTVVSRATLPVIVSAGGELESAQAVEVFCEVEGQSKIVEMVAEGTYVTEGQVVLLLDPSDVKQQIAQQEITLMRAEAAVKMAEEEAKIQQNVADSEVAQARLALLLAELDQEKFVEGDYRVQLNDLKGQIALAEAELQEATDMLKHYKDLVKKGFRTPEQLRAKEQARMRAEYTLDRDREKLRVLEDFTFERETAELAANAEEAERELARAQSTAQAALTKAETDLHAAKTTAEWERSQLEKLKTQLQHCTVKAPQDGTVVYAKDQGKSIEVGANVHFKQKLFSLPASAQMQVKAFVHESVLRKVNRGQRAEVRIDAHPNRVLRGQVEDVATFYDSTRHWLSGGVKEYATTVSIEDLANLEPRPGMTAEVRILVGQLSDALVVPPQAIAEQGGNYYCYIVGPDAIQRRRVSLGDSTDNFVEIVGGLDEGERVALNARARAAADFDDRPADPPHQPDTESTPLTAALGSSTK